MKVIIRNRRRESPQSKVPYSGAASMSARGRKLFSFVVSVSLHAGTVAAVLGLVSLYSPVRSHSSRHKAKVMIIRLPQTADRVEAIDYVGPVGRLALQMVAPTHRTQPPMPLAAESPLRPSTVASALPRVIGATPLMLIDVPKIVGRELTPADLPPPPTAATEPIPLLAVLEPNPIWEMPAASSANVLPSLSGILSSGPGKETWQPSALIKLVHPADGQFDVVLVQTSLADTVPESVGILNGGPVYTVYLHVGDTKEWIMYYCATDTGIVQRGAIVQLPDPRPLKAPYPQLTFRPREPLIASAPHFFVHGIIDEFGLFQNLRIVGQPEHKEELLLKAVSQWRFRPASRADSAVRIEVLLAVPATGALNAVTSGRSPDWSKN